MLVLRCGWWALPRRLRIFVESTAFSKPESQLTIHAALDDLDITAANVGPQRARGLAQVRLQMRRGKAVVADLAQQGSARVMLPRAQPERPELVFLNTSGGLTSGDALSFAVELDAGVMSVAATQTAERAYLAPHGPARLQVAAKLGANARLEWLPQETILFEGCHLIRDTQVDMAMGASCLLVETVVLGRRAMGEVPGRARLRDTRMVQINGRPVWAERLNLDEAVLGMASDAAMLGENVAFSTVALVGQGAEGLADVLHALPVVEGVQVGVSGWNGRCVVRLLAADLWPLKLQLGRVLRGLSPFPLPRIWQMQGLPG